MVHPFFHAQPSHVTDAEVSCGYPVPQSSGIATCGYRTSTLPQVHGIHNNSYATRSQPGIDEVLFQCVRYCQYPCCELQDETINNIVQPQFPRVSQQAMNSRDAWHSMQAPTQDPDDAGKISVRVEK